MSTSLEVQHEITRLVDRWVADGLVTVEQAEKLLADTPEERPSRPGLLIEAFAYLGGVIVLVAAALLAGRFWDELGTGGRLGLVAAIAATLLLSGWAVPDRLGDAAVRLRSVLWALSTGATALLLGLAADQRASWNDDDIALAVSAGTALYAFGLWRWRPALLQHVLVFVTVAATAANLTAHLTSVDGVPGLAIWLTAGIWLLLGWSDLLAPPRLAVAVGAVGLVVGSVAMAGALWGMLLGLATVAAVVGAAVAAGSLPLLGLGALGTLQLLPPLVDRFFPGRLSGPLALLVVGAGLLAAAFRMSRRESPRAR